MLIVAFPLCCSKLKAESKFYFSYFSLEDSCTKRKKVVLQISRELFHPGKLTLGLGTFLFELSLFKKKIKLEGGFCKNL